MHVFITLLDATSYPPSLIRVFTVRMTTPWVLSYPLSSQRGLWSDCADLPFCWFWHEVAQIEQWSPAQKDGWMSLGFTSLQQYFSHFETIEGWTWKALCNEAPFRFGKNRASSGIRTCDPKSGVLTARPRGRFSSEREQVYVWLCGYQWPFSCQNAPISKATYH